MTSPDLLALFAILGFWGALAMIQLSRINRRLSQIHELISIYMRWLARPHDHE